MRVFQVEYTSDSFVGTQTLGIYSTFEKALIAIEAVEIEFSDNFFINDYQVNSSVEPLVICYDDYCKEL